MLTVGADIANTRIVFVAQNVPAWTADAISAAMGKYRPTAWGGLRGLSPARWSAKHFHCPSN